MIGYMTDGRWLDDFIQNNAWSVIVAAVAAVFSFAVFYSTINQKIQAQAKDIEDLQRAVLDIAQNQKDIIVLQQQTQNTTASINDIKNDVRDIKTALNIR